MQASRYQERLCGARYKKAPLTKAVSNKDKYPPCSLLHSFQETVREDPFCQENTAQLWWANDQVDLTMIGCLT